MRKKLILIILVILFFTLNVNGYAESTEAQYKIVINIPSRKLTLFKNDMIIKEYPIAVGKSKSQTPIGEFKIINKVINPYYAKKKIPGGSPKNPLGSRWMGFKIHYGIHGNSDPSSIGTFASGGCIRMYERDIQEIFQIVPLGTPVQIKYDLIEKVDDIDGEEPILIIYPDYYNKVRNLKELIKQKLEDLNLYNEMSEKRLEEVANLAKNEKIIFSNNLIFFINKKYITNDIKNIEGIYYINLNKFEKWLNINVPIMYNENYAYVMGSFIKTVYVDNKYYIALADIQKLLGGQLVIDKDANLIELNADTIFLNNKYLSNQVLNITTNPKIRLSVINKYLDISIQFKQNEIKYYLKNGKELSYELYEGIPYVDVNYLKENTELILNISTFKNQLTITKSPMIIFDGFIYESILYNNEMYIPLNVLMKDDYNLNDANNIFVNFERIPVIYLEDTKYIPFEKVKNMFNLIMNDYGTKIVLYKRIFNILN
ncbi:L,D-transpeptidase [Caloranaerobacter sp. TR13]|uniref:L,D-transpeptidase n=1 Tax=Caloranaerobacter sp. TR13 TaxID=1302151 RepID=UPI0006D3FEBD|nr:L,D-transpeptidase [Caloranaerobacter sp. TR13]